MSLKKIISISGEDWMRGISLQPTIPIGGIFRSAVGFDPFATMGQLIPGRNWDDRTTDGTTPIAHPIRYIVNYNDNGAPLAYLYADNGTDTTYLYEIATLTHAITDRSSSISTTGLARGAASYRGFLVYALKTTVEAIAMPVSGGTKHQIISGLNDADHPMTIGADLNLYGADDNSIFKISKDADLTAVDDALNLTGVFSLESGMHIRDLKSDGRYLVFIADDSPSRDGLNSANCMIAYWDYSSGSLTKRYDFKDNGMLGLEVVEGNAYVFGKNNFYVTNVATHPKIITAFTGNSNIKDVPVGPAGITKVGNIIQWCNSSTGKIWAYGNPIPGKNKIFFNPTATAAVGGGTALSYNGFNLLLATDTPKLYLNSNTTNDITVQLSDIILDAPYKLGFIKVILSQPLFSGNSVSIQINSQQGSGLILLSSTFSYTDNGAKQIKIFRAYGGGSSATRQIFNEITDLQIETNCAIQSFEIWAEEIDPQNESY